MMLCSECSPWPYEPQVVTRHGWKGWMAKEPGKFQDTAENAGKRATDTGSVPRRMSVREARDGGKCFDPKVKGGHDLSEGP